MAMIPVTGRVSHDRSQSRGGFHALLAYTHAHSRSVSLSIYVAIIFWVVSLMLVVYALKRVKPGSRREASAADGRAGRGDISPGRCSTSRWRAARPAHAGRNPGHDFLWPWAAILVMTCVVGVQALIFQDGGLLALGANIFNMAIIGVSVSYFAYRTVQRLHGGDRGGLFVGGFAAPG